MLQSINSKNTMKHSKPFVSVIILSFNGEEYLYDCIDSVLKTNYPVDCYEVIVADNNSTDNSRDIVLEHYKEEVKLLKFDKNLGFAKGNNLALESAKGDLIIFLNQDTVVNKLWIEGLVDAITHSNFDACQSNIIMPRNEDFHLFKNRDLISKCIYFYELNKYGYVSQVSLNYSSENLKTNFLSGCSFIIKREVTDKLDSLFDASTVLSMFGFVGSWGEDIYLSKKLLKNGYIIGISPKSITYHFSGFHWNIDKFNFFKNIVMIRNRYIVLANFTQNTTQFIKTFPYIFFSQFHKIFFRLRKSGKSAIVSFVIALVGIPLSLISFIYFIGYYFQGSKK